MTTAPRRDYWSDLDLYNNEIKNVVIDKVTTMPTTATQGRLVYFAGTDATNTYHTGSLYVGSSTAWVELAQGGDTNALSSRLSALETTVGNDSSGLVLSVKELRALVGASAEEGLRKDVADLKTTTAAQDSRISTNAAGVEANKGSITALEGKVGEDTDEASATGTLYARSKKNAADISTTKSDLTAFSGKLKTAVSASDAEFPTSKAVQTYVTTYVSGKLTAVLTYKGNKATVAEVRALTGMVTGDVWHVTADGSEWAYDGTNWQELGTVIDLSSYATIEYVGTEVGKSVPKTTTVNGHALSANVTVTKGDVGLGNVDNTSDKGKPLSDAAIAALGNKVDKLATAPTSGTYTKVTIDEQGLVKSGSAKIGVADITDIADNYLGKTATAAAATKLATKRQISISGGATAAAIDFDGTGNVALNVTSVDATKLSGTIDAARIPALPPEKIQGTIPAEKLPFKTHSTAISNVTTINLDVAIPYGLLVVDSNMREVFCEVVLGSGETKAKLNFSRAFTGTAYYIG